MTQPISSLGLPSDCPGRFDGLKLRLHPSASARDPIVMLMLPKPFRVPTCSSKQLVSVPCRRLCRFYRPQPITERISLSPVTSPVVALAKFEASTRANQIARHFSSSTYPSSINTTATATMASQYQVRKIGAPNTLEHRIYIEKDGVPVSPFHDIPLYANQEQTILNMIVEIPRWTNAKMEVSARHKCSIVL